MALKSKKTQAKNSESKVKHIGLVKNDAYLEPYEEAIKGRHDHALWKLNSLTNNGKTKLTDFANGHKYYGLHKAKRGWVFREWAPNATAIYLVGDFNGWTESERYSAKRIDEAGNWELKLSEKAVKHGDLFKMHVYWDGGMGERIPAWATRVVQDEETKIFSAQVWNPEPYEWKKTKFKANKSPLFIYECHIGMAQDAEKVGTYNEFRENVLPRIKKDGYNCIQIMAIQEHPYYGSFGYHVSSFFAASSRFGTPEDLKALIDQAHKDGIAVIMDIVHSHAVKNEIEGLGNLAGDPNQYFYPGEKHEHPAWDSLCFDYGKDEVIHFLLSNCKYWLEEYHLDGFRFDGVTSMIYWDHGLGKDFNGYEPYFDAGVDENAVTYLGLANLLIRQIKPEAVTIAEDVSGMAGLAAPFEAGGVGFGFRMAMGVADHWIKWIKEKKDEEWSPGEIWYELTNKRADEKTISYAECHDQALVGDKTLIFRLLDKEMYFSMNIDSKNPVVDRGIALHKLIRLVTIGTAGDGYLNFMGNEFGHPEWIDFPREGNNWSYEHARRMWSLADNGLLRYHCLQNFDKAMVHLVKRYGALAARPELLRADEEKKILIFRRKNLIFALNFNPVESFADYAFPAPSGDYVKVLDSDAKEFDGFARLEKDGEHLTVNGCLSLYLPSRCALVLIEKTEEK